VGGVGELGERRRGVRAIAQVDGDVACGRLEVRGPPRQRDDGPVRIRREPLDDRAPDHSDRSDDDGVLAWHR
jgi:hypothetical protein